MSVLQLGRLIAAPGVAVGTAAEPWGCLSSGAVALPADHPALSAARRRLRSGLAPPRVSLAAETGLLNLGRDSGDPGLVLLLTPKGAGSPEHQVTWVVWGLSRPSVNLFLGPALRGPPAAIGSAPDPEKILQIMNSNVVSDIDIEIDVTVEHVLQPLTYRIYPDTPVHEVQHLMLRRELAVVPVVGKDHEMLGVITVSDLLSGILPGTESTTERRRLVARDIMKRAVLCVSEDESLIEASRSMIAREVSQLPVVSDGRLVGFVDRETVLRAFADTVVVPSGSAG